MKVKIIKIIQYVIALALVVIQAFPLIWIFVTSFKNIDEFRSSNPFSLPKTFSLTNYMKIFEKGDILVYFKNSVIITGISVIFIVLLSSTAAFAISKFQFKICKIASGYFMLGIMIPIQVALVPLFQIYTKMHLTNSYLSLILPQIGFALPIAIFLFTAFYEFIPKEMYEAAIVDGCEIRQLFTRIVIPMARNTIVTVTTINAINIWNEFMLANTFVSDTQMKTLPLGLYDYIGEYGYIDWGQTFAAIAISVLPTLFVYFFLNKKIISGMAAGAVKS